jgi:hypothetical protein
MKTFLAALFVLAVLAGVPAPASADGFIVIHAPQP